MTTTEYLAYELSRIVVRFEPESWEHRTLHEAIEMILDRDRPEEE